MRIRQYGSIKPLVKVVISEISHRTGFPST